MQLKATSSEMTMMPRSSKCGWMGSSLMGPPTILFSLAVLAELVFWMAGIESQLSEVWLVLVAVPLLLHFTSPKAKPTQPKKIVEDDADDVGGKGRPEKANKVPGSRKGLPKAALGVKSAAKEASPIDEARAALKAELDKCVQAGDIQAAAAVLQQLVDSGAANAVCFNMIISLCAKQNQPKDAQTWMRQMLESSIKPDAASFNATIDACARAGDTSKA